MKSWLMALLFAPFALFGFGCQPSSSKIRLILPDYYKGPVKIKQSAEGASVKKDGGVWIFEIPSTGALETQNTEPLRRIQIPGEAVYISGVTIPWALPEVIGGVEPSDGVMLRQLGTDADGWYYFFIGTSSDAKSYWGKVNGSSGSLP
jgi:hypothetical protein